MLVGGRSFLSVHVAERMVRIEGKRMIGVSVVGVRAVEAVESRRRRPGLIVEAVAALGLEKGEDGLIWDMKVQTLARLPIACAGRLARLLPKDLLQQVGSCLLELSVFGSCSLTDLFENLYRQALSGRVHVPPVQRSSRFVRVGTALHELWLLLVAVRAP